MIFPIDTWAVSEKIIMILRLISKVAGQCHRDHPDAEGMTVRSGNGQVMNAANDEKGQGSEPASDAAESGNSETIERRKGSDFDRLNIPV